MICACLLAALTGKAQQNDVYDIKDYLQKKNKVIYPPIDPSKLFPKKQMGLIMGVMPVQPNTTLLPNGDTLRYGNGTMPCVKPDMRNFRQLPASESGGLQNFENTMPYGAIRKEG